MPRAQVYLVLGTLDALAGLFSLLGGHWLPGVLLLATGLFFVVSGVTRMLQLAGHLRDPAPWERRPR
jgi:hypothetical protein